MKRRKFITVASLSALCSKSFGAEGDDEIKTLVDEFMKNYNAAGLSVAFAFKGVLKYQGAFGFADSIKKRKLTTDHQFRIASISKPITSVGIFRLIEQGKLTLDTPVFGKGGVLKYTGPEGITIHHLLTHTSGGWKNDWLDPMFRSLDLGHDELIKWTLKHYKLASKPGEKYAYSNFGYCLLGRVIEQVSGMKYAEFITKEALVPSGVNGMTIGELKPKKNEVEYFDMKGKVIRYPMNISRMDSHGGWVGTPTDLVKFATHVDGIDSPKDILSKESIKQMTDFGGVEKSYACGWSINKHGNYWHGGSLPGLTSILVRTKSGFCWSACVNTRSNDIFLALDRLMWKLSRLV